MLASPDGDWFEPVEGKKPWGVQEVDPSRRFAVLEVSGDDEDRHVAVGNLTSGKLVWAPERAHAIRWCADDPDDMLCSQMSQGPLFLDNQRFRVLPPTGERKTYTINGDEVADPDAGTKVDINRLTVSLRPTKH